LRRADGKAVGSLSVEARVERYAAFAGKTAMQKMSRLSTTIEGDTS
jgi:hypothetical protein